MLSVPDNWFAVRVAISSLKPRMSMYAMRAFSYWTLRLTVGAAIYLGSKNDSSKLHDPSASGVGAYRFWRSRLLLQDQFEFLDERLTNAFVRGVRGLL